MLSHKLYSGIWLSSLNIAYAKYSSIGKWPKYAKGFGSQKWLDETKEAIENIVAPKLKNEVMDAFIKGRIGWNIFPWPQ